MKLFILAFCLVFLSTINPAYACRFIQLPFDQSFQSANIIFIGKVSAVENGKVAFSVDAAIRGTHDGAAFSTEIGQSSCDIRFQTGETWLYMGSSAPSGSLLLVSETGQVQTDNAKLAKEKTGFDVTTDATAFNGTLRNSCAPWDGAAFSIDLKNGLHAQVWTSVPEIGFFSKTYTADMNAGKKGDGSIVYCEPVPLDAPPVCKRLEGSITLTEIKNGAASGHIDVKEGEFSGRNAFHVRMIRANDVCG